MSIPRIIKFKPKVWDVFCKWCEKGGARHPAIGTSLLYGAPPELMVKVVKDTTGHFDERQPHRIALDKGYADAYEQNPLDMKLRLVVEKTILHELVHWHDFNADKTSVDYEIGDKFENEAYGP